MWRGVIPELPVADVVKTQEYYRDRLGFQIAWIWEDSYGAVTNGDTELFFIKAEGAVSPATCYILVDDADAVYALYRENGVEVVEEIESTPWGMREFTIQDLNGHRFRVGHGEKDVDEIEGFNRASA